jgi:lipoprotein NlpI
LRLLDYDHALADFTKAIELSPEYANAYQNRGVARQVTGDIAGAQADREMFQQLVARQRHSADRR